MAVLTLPGVKRFWKNVKEYIDSRILAAQNTFPTKVSDLQNDAGYYNQSTLPPINNGILTIQKNGQNVSTFSATISSATVSPSFTSFFSPATVMFILYLLFGYFSLDNVKPFIALFDFFCFNHIIPRTVLHFRILDAYSGFFRYRGCDKCISTDNGVISYHGFATEN